MALGKKSNPVDARKAGSVEAALRRSLRAAVAGDLETAETWLERIVEADTQDRDAYHALARLYREQGDVGRAIRMHQNLLLRGELDKRGRIEALLELARDFDQGGFRDQAISSYEEVVDAEPRNGEALARLVLLLQEVRDFDRALALVKRWRRIDRDRAVEAEVSILLESAEAQRAEGDAEAARSTLKKCLRRDKQKGQAWLLLGELEAERGKDARAADAWRKGALACPEMGPIFYPKLDASFAARNKGADYEKFLRSVLAAQPLDQAARIALTRAQVARGESREAIEELARAVEVSPADASLRVELGRQLLAAGLEGEALKAYSELLEVLERGATGLLSSAPEATSS